MSQRLFISYRTHDAVFAGRIYDSLKQRFGTDRIFFDQRSIRAGSKWDAEIDRSLAECGAFVLVITPRWLASFAERAAEGGPDYHLREIELALDRGVPIFPLVIDEAEPPSDRALPEQLRGRLSRIQWERVRNDRTFDDSMDRLCDQLDAVVGGGGDGRGTRAPSPTVPANAAAWTPQPAPLGPPPGQVHLYAQGPAYGYGVPPRRSADDLLASRDWRLRHSPWLWAVLCCGFTIGPGFLYMGAKAERRAWTIAGAVYLALAVASVAVFGVVTDGRDGNTSAEDAVVNVYMFVWLVGVIHLAVVNGSWLRVQASKQGRPPSPPPPPPPPASLRPPTAPPPSTGPAGSRF